MPVPPRLRRWGPLNPIFPMILLVCSRVFGALIARGAVAEASDGATGGELAADVEAGHGRGAPAAGLLHFHKRGAGGGQGLCCAHPERVARHPATDAGSRGPGADDCADRARASPGGRRDTNGSRGESVVHSGWRTTPGGIVGSGSGVHP